MPCCAAITAAPERTLPISPRRERVPSGNISRLQPSPMMRSTWSVAPLPRPPPPRPSGTVLNTSATQRAQDRRRVEVARVVGDEDDRALEVVEDLAADRAAADVPVDHRAEAEPQQPLAQRPRVAAAGPGDVHLGVLARQLGAARAQLGAARPELVAELRHALAELRNPLLELGHPLPQLLALLDRAIESA